MRLIRFVLASTLLALPLLGAAQRPRSTRWAKGRLPGTTRAGICEYYSYAATGERVVATLGHLSQHRVVRGIGSGCDEEALRVSRTTPDTRVPGRRAGRAGQAVGELPFTFRLQ